MQAILINEVDSVGVALQALKAGTKISLGGHEVVLTEDIERGHKFALKDIKEGEPVLKYGYPIGRAKVEINAGSHVHTQNVKTDLSGDLEYEYKKAPKAELKKVEATFNGYVRPNGDVGIRNELWIIPTVFCVNGLSRVLEKYGNDLLNADRRGDNKLKNIDACVALTHPYGCSQMGEDQKTTLRVLASLAQHPNCGAVLVVGLGCENNNINVFKEYLPQDERIFFLNSQEADDEVEEGYALVDKIFEKISSIERTPVSIDKLRIGLKCGGSDGLSGITANPLIGRLSDLIVGSSGTSVMTEVPEMFGAEQILMNRAKDEPTFNKCVSLINDFKHYFISHGQVVSENPSPGNKAGGITTLEDKSLGCVQKGGRAEVCGVLKYGENLKDKGLNLLQAPGNDGVSCTALAAAGCHMVLFSTGRGTPFGTVVPTVKISTNSQLFNKKGAWIDFNAGAIVEGRDFETMTQELLDYVIGVASGNLTKSEAMGYREIVIWKDGVTM